MNYKDMTIQDLEKKSNELHTQKQLIRDEMLKIQAEISTRQDEEEVKKIVGKMSPERAKRFAQVISNVGGIQSQEQVGTPGN